MAEYDKDNIFAKILRGEMPCHQIYEDEDCFALMDIMPRSNGHCLVIPKKPSRNILDADAADLATLIGAVQRVGRACIKGLSADGLTIQQFNEQAGGQIVYHLHFHVIPRYDGEKMRPHSSDMEDNEVLAANAEKIRAALG